MVPRNVKYLIDSCILIDHFNAIKPATEFLRNDGSVCVLSAISRAEVLVGFDQAHEKLARELLDIFTTLPVTADTADLAAQLRRSHRWKLPDALQAALACEYKLTLVTRNSKDFRPGGEPEVLVPYQL